jgi:hypothetical protein
MARDSFNSVTGGLVNSVVSNIGGATSASIKNIGNPNPATGGFASFSVNSLLAKTIKDTSGVALNLGENYLTSQITSVLPSNQSNALLNSVATQVAQAGVKKLTGFVSQSFGGLFGGLGSNVTTAGLAGQASRSSKSISDSVVSQLPAAEYGGSAYTLDDIVFTLVPANAGAQTAPQGQSPVSFPGNIGFDAEAAKSLPSMDALKGTTALAGPGSGLNVGGRNFGANYSLGSASKIKPLPVKF